MTLTAKIIELVPELGEERPAKCSREGCNEHWETVLVRPITLADVLRAIEKGTRGDGSYFVRDEGTFFQWEKFTEGGSGHHGVRPTFITWNLSTDLEGQSDETKAFISKILGV